MDLWVTTNSFSRLGWSLASTTIARDTGLSYVRSGWLTHPVQADPRWPVFLKKMGFDDSLATDTIFGEAKSAIDG